MEIYIIIAVSVIIVSFEIATIRHMRNEIRQLKYTLKSHKVDIDAQEYFIKILQKDYNICIRDRFKYIREKLSE